MTQVSGRAMDMTKKRKALLDALMAERGLRKTSSERIRRSCEHPDAPLSFAQQRLWFIDQFQPGSSAYNIPIALRLGVVDADALKRALDAIVRRHEVLRTCFTLVNHHPRQVVLPPGPVTMPVHDLQEHPPERREDEARRLAEAEARRPFNIPRGPHFRASLLRLGPSNHILLLTLHHIVSDGWSTGVLLRELTEIYQAEIRGQPSSLADLPIQYADFARWQSETLVGEIVEQQLTYWRQQLAGAPPILELPTDHPRPPAQTFQGATKSFLLPLHVSEGLKALGKQDDATFFMVLLAAFRVLLHRYTRENDIVIGSPIANRTRRELEPLIGPFANTLALRTDLSGDPTFRELLLREKKTTLDAYANQDLPFEKLVEALQPDRTLSYSPLFQVLFILQNLPSSRSEPATAPVATPDSAVPLHVHTGTAKFDLTVIFTETEGGLAGYLEYDSTLFETATMDIFLTHLQTLLQSVVTSPDAPVRGLQMQTPAEVKDIVRGWNATSAAYPQQCAQELFAAQAALTPDQVAVEFCGEHVTYRDLNERANRLANFLKQQGVGPETRVGICMERSLEVVVALLAVIKAGGAHTPLDPGYPKERLSFMLGDSRVQFILTQSSMLNILPEHSLPTVLLDAEWDRVRSFSAENPPVETCPDNLAYVVYTSGSTGRPKGVAMRHRTLANLFQWQLTRYRPNPAARTVQFTSFSFDVSVQEILNTLCTGGVLVMMPEELRRDPVRTAQFLIDKRIERLYLPFTALHQLCEAFEHLDAYPTALQEIVSTGEQMRLTETIRRALGHVPGLVLHNQYGPTETHFATGFSLAGDPHSWPTLPSVGRPLTNARIYVLDEHLQPVPIGVPGEVYIGGVPIARGYLERPRQNAEKFRPDPFCDEPGARIYQTGDLARFRADGNLTYIGRLDHQIKIRGFRIELGEIEAVLVKHPAVRSAVVVPIRDASGDNSLMAYVVPEAGQVSTVPELRRHLKEKLPDYMVPAKIVMSSSMPMSPNGKVDRKVLSMPEPAQRETDESYVPPGSATEKTLATIFSDVLGLDRVGINDNFFEVGGHSLLATQVISRIETALNVRVPLRRFFDGPTIGDLALTIEENQKTPA
jgi:amino acid adenylation domain-containing protein